MGLARARRRLGEIVRDAWSARRSNQNVGNGAKDRPKILKLLQFTV